MSIWTTMTKSTTDSKAEADEAKEVEADTCLASTSTNTATAPVASAMVVEPTKYHASSRTAARAGTSNAVPPAVVIVTPTQNDILCGKDKSYSNHEGNQIFRAQILEYLQEYQHQTKIGRMAVTKQIVSYMAQRGAKFVRKLDDTLVPSGQWVELTNSEARDKISHALRFALRQQKHDLLKQQQKQQQAQSQQAHQSHPQSKQQSLSSLTAAATMLMSKDNNDYLYNNTSSNDDWKMQLASPANKKSKRNSNTHDDYKNRSPKRYKKLWESPAVDASFSGHNPKHADTVAAAQATSSSSLPVLLASSFSSSSSDTTATCPYYIFSNTNNDTNSIVENENNHSNSSTARLDTVPNDDYNRDQNDELKDDNNNNINHAASLENNDDNDITTTTTKQQLTTNSASKIKQQQLLLQIPKQFMNLIFYIEHPQPQRPV